MKLSDHISTLLYRYECVVVPNFGAFLSHKISARIDSKTQTLYPPKKRLSFNEQLTSNDGILANHVSESEKISYENALAKIAKQVNEMQRILNKNQTVVLNSIGNLQLNKNGILIFEPCYKLNYLTDAFGLSEFLASEISRGKIINFQRAKKNPTKSLIKYAAVGILLISLAGVFNFNYNQYIEDQNIIAQEKANVLLGNQIQEATFAVRTPLPPLTLNLKINKGNFHVVAGAFRVKKNSERKLRELKRLGFNANIIGQNSYGLYQVVFESFPTREQAIRKLYKIKKEQNPEAWLLVKDLN